MYNIFSTAEFVEKFGNGIQKENFRKNRKLMPKIKASIIKTAEEYYDSVEFYKEGRENFYKCYGERINKAKRRDDRSKNGQGQLVGEYELKSYVIDYLLNNNNRVSPMSTSKWLKELEIIDYMLFKVFDGERKIHTEQLQQLFSKFVNGYQTSVDDIELLDNFLQVTMRSLKMSLLSVFKKLADTEVIIYRTEIWGCTTHGNHRKLLQQEIIKIEEIRNELFTKNGIESRDMFKTKKKEVIAFTAEFEKELQVQLKLKYSYQAHFCVIQNGELEVTDYLHSLQEKGLLDFEVAMSELAYFRLNQRYKNSYRERSLKLALEREKNITNHYDTDRIKKLKVMKHYVPTWDLLLSYFGFNTLDKSILSLDDNKFPLDSQKQQYSMDIGNQNSVPYKNVSLEKIDGYREIQEDIWEEIRNKEDTFEDNFEVIYEDKDTEQLELDKIIKEMTKEVSVEEVITEMKKKYQESVERDKREWEKQFEGSQPQEWQITSNNPLEIYERITKTRSK